ncbi:hypothetical protein [Mycobacterium shottsii]|nr:hypothetical protein [Mycobacterium shottsii]
MSDDELLEALCALEDKSILIRTAAQDVLRFRQLATLREFGYAKLSVQEQAELHRSHLDWYRQLAEKACEEWFGEHQLDWLHRLRREMPNLQEALQVALTVAPADAVEMATNLRDPWTAIGMLQQGRRWIEKALDAGPRRTQRGATAGDRRSGRTSLFAGRYAHHGRSTGRSR